MLRNSRQTEVIEKSQSLLNGSLRHVRAAALAALLVPLAAVPATTVLAQGGGSGGTASVPSPCDFATSGGFVFTDGGKEVNFGAHGGCKNGAFWGDVNVVDHTNGYHVNSLDVTGYLTPSPGSNIRDICGSATTNGAEAQPVYFRIRIVDNGEPGVADQFGMRLSNGYVVTTRLLGSGRRGGGNVQLHDPNPSTRAPEPVPSESAMCNGVAEP